MNENDSSASWVAVRGEWKMGAGSMVGRYQCSVDQPDNVMSTLRSGRSDFKNFKVRFKSTLKSWERSDDHHIQMGLLVRTNAYRSSMGNDLPEDYSGIRCLWEASRLQAGQQGFGHRIFIHEDVNGQGPLAGWRHHEELFEAREPNDRMEGVVVEHEISCQDEQITYSALVIYPEAMGLLPQRLGPLNYRTKRVEPGHLALALFSISPQSDKRGVGAVAAFEGWSLERSSE